MSQNTVADCLSAQSNLPTMLTTAQAAIALNRKPATLNKWAFTKSGPLQPIRINRRLAWPSEAVAALLNGGQQ
jgi:hypothetical protein